MTAIAKALRDAGYVQPAERITRIAIEALGASPDAQKQQEVFLHRVQTDADLLWHLFAPWRHQAAVNALRLAEIEIRKSAPAEADPVAELSETPRRKPGPESGTGQDESDNQRGSARPASPPSSVIPSVRPALPPEVRPTAARPVGLTPEVMAVSRVARGVLEAITLDGKPIGKCTAREANAHADRDVKRARFIRLLTANLPPDEPIEKFRKEDEAVKILAQANAQELVDA